MQTMTVSKYLILRLKEIGIDDLFSVPGDFNLVFLDRVQDSGLINLIGDCNELNASYAADGYARVKGVGAIITTFGVGELSAVNGIAGSYSEMVPVVKITGTPNTKSQASGALLHHTLGNGDFRAFQKMFSHITVTNTTLLPHNAAAEIDRVLTECVQKVRPVYISLPTDVVDAEITVDMKPLNLALPANPEKTEAACVREIVNAVAKAKQPIIVADACAIRHHCEKELLELIEKTGLPYYTTPMGKAVIGEDHPQFRGIYVGSLSSPRVKEEVEGADLILSVGGLKSDFNTGSFSYRMDAEKTVEIHSDYTDVFYGTYKAVGMKYLLPKLAAAIPKREVQSINLSVELPKIDMKAMVPQAWFWNRMGKFFKPNDIVLAETGTSVFGCLNSHMPEGATFISQILWGSIGYTVGGCLGAAVAGQERRVILFVGDGSFQLTCQEVSVMIRLGLRPIIFLLNNNGYTIERLIHGVKRTYNDIDNWDFSKTLDYFGGAAGQDKIGFQGRANTAGEFEQVLKKVESHADKINFVEVMMDWLDAPENLVKQAEASAALNRS
ncbi:pyruvate decarboxylase isozyme [Basidiobolus meristosporus CBS 931.73]|uniref:Pyruvate decarboxylase isozyme n=1 Tax=Basidiobolus meristosporus CBS 931.73 TaxID=1314790 RepID=A0A1Y1Z993_9FUNG|nr:pyruvate decarboxylase isozyme [Basidiobolus meristosporus CBS 931.73]|eukprot:ORY06850.1 pyruvate decarboxylase isozyme [Basidiobolus meristosporus CBS 931.73]